MNSELRSIIKQILTESDVPRILDVPHYLQSDDSTCGPASLRMVMSYYGLNMSEEDIAGACGHSYELGCRSEDMACAAQALGFEVLLKNNSTIEELVRLVNAGVPVIVDWFCGDPPEGHSSVVVGASDKDLYILDPYLEEMRVVSKFDFRRCWFDFYETPITPDNLYVGQIMVLRPKKNFKQETNDKEDVQEMELKERCWKGYTQKGMKTMFGKRYPNCVKKKK
jgi:ABC-type bacteriocin/lantibiotic exporter with double-glycine peptidase domain